MVGCARQIGLRRAATHDDGVALDELGEDATGGLDTEGERADVDQNHALEALLAAEDAGLDGGTVRDGLVRVDALGRLLAVEEVLQEGLDTRNASRTTDEDDVVDVLPDQPRFVAAPLRTSFFRLASLSTCSTGLRVLRNRSALISSNLARVRVSDRSCRVSSARPSSAAPCR